MKKQRLTLLITLSIIVTIISLTISGIYIFTDNKENAETQVETTGIELKETEPVEETTAVETQPQLVEETTEVIEETTEAVIEETTEIVTTSAILNPTKEEVYNEIISAKTTSEPIVYNDPVVILEIGEYARQIWNTLINTYGMSYNTAAGILGNIMQECGGRTLTGINPWSSGCGYGLCQWTSGRASSLKAQYPNCTVDEQLAFMYSELTGGIQVSYSHCQEILNADTPETAAYLFAKYFERCGGSPYTKRQDNARKAYNSFLNS